MHLLRVLESWYVTRVGDHRPIPVDVRVIAATQTDLMKKVREGTFRKDLWFRLAVLTIVIPPLRDRKADIPALVGHFLRTKAAQFEMEVPDVPAPSWSGCTAMTGRGTCGSWNSSLSVRCFSAEARRWGRR